ncbi:MAG: beta-ketoacyl-[acyl-carrier-protein] synthase family protein [Acidobacteriota bacterium]
MKRTAPVAITGIGCLCAAGDTVQKCMEAVFRGERNPTPPRTFFVGREAAYPVFEVSRELPNPRMPGKSGVLRTSRLALAATLAALEDAGLDRNALGSRRVGVCIGTTVGSAMNNEDFYKEYRDGQHPNMAPIERFLASNPASVLAREFEVMGPCQTVVNACASGTDAVGIGASWIRAGLCDIVLSGGADELCRVTYEGFISLLVTDAAPCRPFDVARKGLNLGEGAALLVLESEESREARGKGARSYVLGYGSAGDAYHLTAPDPKGRGLKRAINEALGQAGLSPAAVAFVNAHGTGTADNDLTESKVLAEILPSVPFLSTKGCTGHTLGAAGAIEAVFTVACLEERRIPASAGYAEPDCELPASPVDHPTPIVGNVALSESLAFGGHNAVLLLGTP